MKLFVVLVVFCAAIVRAEIPDFKFRMLRGCLHLPQSFGIPLPGEGTTAFPASSDFSGFRCHHCRFRRVTDIVGGSGFDSYLIWEDITETLAMPGEQVRRRYGDITRGGMSRSARTV